MERILCSDCYFVEINNKSNLLNPNTEGPQLEFVLEDTPRANTSNSLKFSAIQAHGLLEMVFEDRDNWKDVISGLFSGGQACNRLAFNSRFMVAINDGEMKVFDIETLRTVGTIRKVFPGNDVVLALANTSSDLLAYSQSGSVHVFNMLNSRKVATFSAHDYPVSMVKFNSTDDLIVTASVDDPVCGIFNPTTGEKLMGVQCGILGETIHDLSFSDDDRFLACIDDNANIQIFKLGQLKQRDSGFLWNLFEHMRRSLSLFRLYQTSDNRPFARAQISGVTDLRHKILITKGQKSECKLLCIGSDSRLHEFTFDAKKGGEAKLKTIHRAERNTPEFIQFVDSDPDNQDIF